VGPERTDRLWNEVLTGAGSWCLLSVRKANPHGTANEPPTPTSVGGRGPPLTRDAQAVRDTFIGWIGYVPAIGYFSAISFSTRN
jgi:hypothetical protein